MLISFILCSIIYTTQNTPLCVGAVPSFGNDTDKPPTPKAFCAMDTTIWEFIPGYEGLYEASDSGLIRNSNRANIELKDNILIITSRTLRPKFDKDCYLNVTLTKDSKLGYHKVHNLIAAAFKIPNPNNKPLLDHINGVRWDNRVGNLRYVTQSENLQASYDLGRKIKEGRPICQLDLRGNLIKQYRCISDVSVDGFNPKTVNKAILGYRPTAFGFIWVRRPVQ